MPVDSFVARRVLFALLILTGSGCDWSSPKAKKAKHLERGQAYFEKGQYNEAVLEFKNVVQLDPKDAATHYRLALTYLKLGGPTNLQGAFAELSRTVELDKTNRDAQLNLGQLYLLSNELAKAREHADIVLVSAPQNTEGLILKGRSLINDKHYAEGIAELKTCKTGSATRVIPRRPFRSKRAAGQIHSPRCRSANRARRRAAGIAPAAAPGVLPH